MATLMLKILACLVVCGSGCYSVGEAQNVTVNIGVILELDLFGKVAKPAFELAAQDVNKELAMVSANSSQQLLLHIIDSKGDPVKAASAGVELLQSEAVAIIGPQTSQEAGFVAQLCDAAHVPIISFSATDPLLSSHRFPYFIRLPHSDALQMNAIAALVQHYGWRQVVAVYSDNDYGTGVLSSLSEALREVGSEIAYRSPIPTNADRVFIQGELYKLMTMQPRVFVVHMTFDLGQNLFSVAQDIGMMEDEYVWIITDGFSTVLDVFNASTLGFMKGVLATRSYISNSTDMDVFAKSWKEKFAAESPDIPAHLNIYAYYAYDAVTMVARALQKLDNASFSFSASPLNGTTELTNVKRFQQGEQLKQALSETDFRGLSGWLKVKDGEIAGSAYEILNVVGREEGYRTVAFWREGNGLSERIGNSSPGAGFDHVIWPGGSEKAPRGWATPANRKKVLRIGVPIKSGFDEFVETTPEKQPTVSGGFVIDVFKQVLTGLPYALPYKFFPYGSGNGTPSYDELIQKVYRKEYDALVGDFTILANRSNYVDFTQPYSESGLVMVVPIKKADSSNAWAFMRPFTPGMWIATGGFFLFTGIVVWLLEHKRNDTFRGKPRRQIVTLLWFSFSTLFFSQRERIVSSLARGVVIIWLFVVLILTSSYTASLTSILTVQQMEPTITDVQSLIASGSPVGYQIGSFVGHYLTEQLGIPASQLKQYSTAEEYSVALSKGPNNGGVAAIFDEIPYIRVFLSSQCGYSMVGPTYRTGGLGFVFPKGSPLVSDVSKAVLELSESPEMQRIQNKWFNMTACTKAGIHVDSDRLSMESFWGLYLITGTASIIALLLFLGRLLYRYFRHSSAPQESSISAHVKSFVKYADQKEPPSKRRSTKFSDNSPSSTPTPTPTPSPSPSPTAIGGFVGETTPESIPFSDRASSLRSSSSSSSSAASWVSIDLDSDMEEQVDHQGLSSIPNLPLQR